MKPNTTLKKISTMLNLSISTVSRALKDHPDISEQTKQKVQELATLLEYEPNTFAINLRTENSRLLSVMIPTVSNFFYHSFIAALEEESRKKGYTLLIFQSGDDPAVEMENLRICKANRITGLFACLTPESTDISSFLKLEKLGIPVIFFDKVPASDNCNKICVADALAARLAAEVLLTKRKKHVLALFGNPHLSITQKRLTAFTETFQDNDPEAVIEVEYALSAAEAQQITFAFLSQTLRPDALFCMSDEVLTGAMKALQQNEIRIPAEIGVVAISNGLIPTLYYPEISYVETSGPQLATLAFQRMMACLAGSTYRQELTLDARFVTGGSL